MKKNLLLLFALVCSISLFTACSDDDDPVVPKASDLAGTYTGTLTLTLMGSSTAMPDPVSIDVVAEDDNHVTVSLSNFELTEGVPLNIEVDKCAVAWNDNVASLSGSKELSLDLFPGMPLPTTVTGTVNGSEINLDIQVTDAPVVGTVGVTFEGTKGE